LEGDVFDLFKSSGKKSDDSELTSLDLRTEAAPRADAGKERAAAKAGPGNAAEGSAPAGPIQNCLQIGINPETMLALGKDFKRRSDEWMKSGQRPQVVFYLVFPLQGHTVTVSSQDGTKTIVPLFGSKWIADAYLRGKKLPAAVAACRVDALAEQADRWVAAGVNSYALNPCFRCGHFTFYPIAELQTEEQFVQSWGLDAIMRRQFAEIMVRNCQTQLGKNQKGVRDTLERVRDHLDGGVPYLHWVIAVLAGIAGDMPANAAAIQRLEEFGPDFKGKLQGTSFDPSVAGSQISTMAEAMLGLLASYGIVNLPMKPTG
jgi:hypothetical protein